MSTAASFPPGHRLGPYELIELIGRGGFGEVYRARDVRLDRDVAVKIAHASFSREEFKRLEVEARATAALSHPHIIAIHDVGSDGAAAYVVTELLRGESLRAVIRRGPVPAGQAVAYGLQMLDALAAAHAKGIVHRDLKPDNVFVEPDRRIKVLDFGLAKLTARPTPLPEQSTQSVLTGAGDILGTPSYLSPEQARGIPVDHRSDLFAFGIVLYEMLAGIPPFRAASLAEAMSILLRDDPPPLPGGTATPELERLVRRCLEKEPGARFQSASDLRFALEALSPTPVSRRRPVWAIAAVVAATAIVLAGWRGEWLSRAPTGAMPAARTVRETVRVTKDVDRALIANVFPGVTLRPIDATSVEVEALEARLPQVVSVIHMADRLKQFRFADEPAIAVGGGDQLFTGVSQSQARVSVRVSDVPVREFLLLVAKSIGWPVVFDASVRGTVTLSMDDVPWELIVRSCMEFQGAGLASSRVGAIWLVTSRDRAARIADGRLTVWITRARRLGRDPLARAFAPVRSANGLILPHARLDAVVVLDRFESMPDYARVLATIDGINPAEIQYPRPGNLYSGRRVSFDFTNERIRKIVENFRQVSTLNIVVESPPAADPRLADDPFSGTLTDVPWDNAFDVVVLAADRLYSMRDRIVYVTPVGRDMTDPMVDSLALHRDDPMFFKPFEKYLSQSGALSIEPETRTIVIRDVGYRVRALRRWIQSIDDRVRP